MYRSLIAAFAILAIPSPSVAQADRYDTGRRLVAFERAWDATSDAAARKQTLPFLKQAMATFFSGRLGDAGQLIDRARFALAGIDPTPDQRAASALAVRPRARLLDRSAGRLELTVARLYDPKVESPELKLTVELNAGDKKATATESIRVLPTQVSLPITDIPPGDWPVSWKLAVGDKTLCTGEFTVSLVDKLDDRLGALAQAVEKLPTEKQTSEHRTLRMLAGLLTKLSQGASLETDYPAARLLNDAEALDRLPVDGRFFEASRTGQHWITLETAKGAPTVRVAVPAAKENQPVPLVVALHGAGGTENMFFDAYGHGAVVRECEKRGWMLVATRTEFFGAPPVDLIVDELAKRYPIDKSRVFLVGHSMGAGQAIGLAQQHPGRWAGVAALGGGSRVSKPEAFKSVPLFVGVGTEDFALSGARALGKSAATAGGTLVVREYPDIEHIVIVQAALPDVFAWYDKLPPR
ncbi:MAG: alpha/beta hydrolase [Gemmataceae bacterium]|nr:alpha/beta hydrolase [Gemmataceae bacterium]